MIRGASDSDIASEEREMVLYIYMRPTLLAPPTAISHRREGIWIGGGFRPIKKGFMPWER